MKSKTNYQSLNDVFYGYIRDIVKSNTEPNDMQMVVIKGYIKQIQNEYNKTYVRR